MRQSRRCSSLENGHGGSQRSLLIPIDDLDNGDSDGDRDQRSLSVNWPENSYKERKSLLGMTTLLMVIVAKTMVEVGLKSSALVRGTYLK